MVLSAGRSAAGVLDHSCGDRIEVLRVVIVVVAIQVYVAAVPWRVWPM
jgi:hypothetical protein